MEWVRLCSIVRYVLFVHCAVVEEIKRMLVGAGSTELKEKDTLEDRARE